MNILDRPILRTIFINAIKYIVDHITPIFLNEIRKGIYNFSTQVKETTNPYDDLFADFLMKAFKVDKKPE